MKQRLPLLFVSMGLSALPLNSVLAQDVRAANITSKSADEKAGAVNVTLTGTLTSTNNGDFRQLRDLCWQMRTLNLTSANCTAIPNNAFHSRHRLQEVKLPTKLLTIGSQAFFACDSLQGTLSFGANTQSIGASAFNGCKRLEGLKFANGCKLVNIGSYAFSGCTSLAEPVVLPEHLRVLRDGVFSGCTALTSVTLPAELQGIGANTFSGCTSLEGDIIMGRMLTRIGASAFSGCSSLRTLSLPRALQVLGESAFSGCRSLTGRITLPSSLTEMGMGAFQNCEGLESVVLPEALTYVPTAAFAGCKGLKEVVVYASNPPEADATAFAGVNTADCTLYVPEGSEALYADAPVWKDFHITKITSVSDALQAAQVETEVEGSTLWVKHLPQASQVKLYNAAGQLQASARAEGDVAFQLPSRGVWVVTVNGKNFKIKY